LNNVKLSYLKPFKQTPDLIYVVRGSEIMKSKLYCKVLAVGIIVFLINISITSIINAKTIVNINSDEETNDSHNYLFCFIESGYVRHEVINTNGLYFSYPLAFCIGSVILNLTAFHQQPDETRLTIKRISDTMYYGCNVSIILKGFIGKIQPTGSISGGFLKGFALFIRVNEI
jgi:hypothetical protein